MFGGMLEARDEPDEDDWPRESKLREFAELEKVLSCGICKGFLCSPKELPCGHLYCAECLSRSMDNILCKTAKNECPTCRKATLPGQCKANVSLGKVVTIFKGLRKNLLELVEKDRDADKLLLQQSAAAEKNAKTKTKTKTKKKNNKKKNSEEEEEEEEDMEVGVEEEPVSATKSRTRGRPRIKQIAIPDSDDDDSADDSDAEFNGGGGSSLAPVLPIAGTGTVDGCGKRKEGRKIEKVLTFYSFGNKLNENKVRQQINIVTADARARLRTDGDARKLLSRYRNFIHLHNAQVDGGKDALTLEQVVHKCNANETNADREARAAMPTEAAMAASGASGWSALIQAEKEKRAKMRVLAAQQERGQVTSAAASALSSSSSSPCVHEAEVAVVPAQSSSSSSSAVSDIVADGGVAAAMDKGKENTHQQQQQQQQQQQREEESKEYRMGKWSVVWSRTYGKPFFFNTEASIGQLVVPAEYAAHFCGSGGGEEGMIRAVNEANLLLVATTSSSSSSSSGSNSGSGDASKGKGRGRGGAHDLYDLTQDAPNPNLNLTSQAREPEPAPDQQHDSKSEEAEAAATGKQCSSPGTVCMTKAAYAAPAAESNSPVSWNCSMCTYRNPMAKATCEMCGERCHLASKRTRAQKAVPFSPNPAAAASSAGATATATLGPGLGLGQPQPPSKRARR